MSFYAVIAAQRRRNTALFKYAPGVASATPTVTRSTTAAYFDAAGVLQTAGVNTLRDGHYIGGVRTTLLEGQRTNSFLQSDTPATQTITLGTGTFTLWLVGTGSIAIAAGTAVLTGAGTAVAGTPVTITVTTGGTVTCTVTGTPTRAQLENGAFASSYIPTTTAAVTRGADTLFFSAALGQGDQTWYFKLINLGTASLQSARYAEGRTTAQQLSLFRNSASISASLAGINSSIGLGASIGDTVEVRISQVNSTMVLGDSLNGSAEGTAAPSAAFTITSPFISLYLNSDSAGSQQGFAAFLSSKVASGVKTLAEMRAL